jgi:hypothetical protein
MFLSSVFCYIIVQNWHSFILKGEIVKSVHACLLLPSNMREIYVVGKVCLDCYFLVGLTEF